MSNEAPPLGSPVPETPKLLAWPGRLWVILGGLRHALAALGGRDRAAVPMVLLAWTRVGRLATRFELLVARLVAGTLPAPRPPAPARVRVRAAIVDAGAVRLPRGFGWGIRLLQEAVAYGSQLQALLEDPDMAALLASCPRAGRIVRPLRHMLGIPEPGAPVRAPRPQKQRPQKQRWWEAPMPAPCPAVPAGPALFPTGRAPPGWSW